VKATQASTNGGDTAPIENAVDSWRRRTQKRFQRAHHWRPDPSVVAADGARGGGWRRGEVGLADYPPGSYPSCSLHGAMVAVGGEYWRCLIEGCNTGARWNPDPDAAKVYVVVKPALRTHRLHKNGCGAVRATSRPTQISLAEWQQMSGPEARAGHAYLLCSRCTPQVPATASAIVRPAANWRLDPLVVTIEDPAGEAGWRRGKAGIADYLPGAYPACSLHGAMITEDGRVWRCPVKGCELRARWEPISDHTDAPLVIVTTADVVRLHRHDCYKARGRASATPISLKEWQAISGRGAIADQHYAACLHCRPHTTRPDDGSTSATPTGERA
jgi:hypothetical protein